jgi:hypothetical protein
MSLCVPPLFCSNRLERGHTQATVLVLCALLASQTSPGTITDSTVTEGVHTETTASDSRKRDWRALDCLSKDVWDGASRPQPLWASPAMSAVLHSLSFPVVRTVSSSHISRTSETVSTLRQGVEFELQHARRMTGDLQASAWPSVSTQGQTAVSKRRTPVVAGTRGRRARRPTVRR